MSSGSWSGTIRILTAAVACLHKSWAHNLSNMLANAYLGITVLFTGPLTPILQSINDEDIQTRSILTFSIHVKFYNCIEITYIMNYIEMIDNILMDRQCGKPPSRHQLLRHHSRINSIAHCHLYKFLIHLFLIIRYRPHRIMDTRHKNFLVGSWNATEEVNEIIKWFVICTTAHARMQVLADRTRYFKRTMKDPTKAVGQARGIFPDPIGVAN